jgi:pimeloyl-ACP methyl ester carboxylesterase
MKRREFLSRIGLSIPALGPGLSYIPRRQNNYASELVQLVCSPTVPIPNEVVTIWPVGATPGGYPGDDDVFGAPDARPRPSADQRVSWSINNQPVPMYGHKIGYRFSGGDHVVRYAAIRNGRQVQGALTIPVAFAPEAYYGDSLPATSLLPAVPNLVAYPRIIIGFTGAGGDPILGQFNSSPETGDTNFINSICRMVPDRQGDERYVYGTTKNMRQTEAVMAAAVNFIVSKLRTKRYNIVLFGFSRGGYAAMNVAAELAKYDVYVSYLGTIDVVDYMGIPYYPTQAWELPKNVIRARNIRQLYPNQAHGAYVRRASNFYLYSRDWYWVDPQTNTPYIRGLNHAFISDYPPVQRAIAEDINRLT